MLIPEGDPLIADAGFRGAVLGDTPPRATLAYGEPVATAGFHLVQTDTDHWVENVTGLAPAARTWSSARWGTARSRATR